MKRLFTHLAAAAVLLQLGACARAEREVATSSKDPRADYTPPAPGSGARISNRTVLSTVEVSRPFSDPQTPDRFTLQLRGPRILSSRAHFIITSAKGDTLRHEVLPATALLDQHALQDPQAATVRDREIAILRGMNRFFADSNFVRPAVPANAEQPVGLSPDAWADLRQDRRAVGFDYPGPVPGTERRLAYARKIGKAVVVQE